MFEKITKDLTEAMKAKDTFRTSVLRTVSYTHLTLPTMEAV